MVLPVSVPVNGVVKLVDPEIPAKVQNWRKARTADAPQIIQHTLLKISEQFDK